MGTQIIAILSVLIVQVSRGTNMFLPDTHRLCPIIFHSKCQCTGPIAYNINKADEELLRRGASVSCVNVQGRDALSNLVRALDKRTSLSKSMYLTDEHVPDTRVITRFSFVDGRLDSLRKQHLTNMINLYFLNLSSNGIESIDDATFAHLGNLEVLDLSNNRLSSLDVDHLVDLEQLKNLSLQYNRLKTLPDGIFHNNPKLAYLNLLGNYWICDEDLVWLEYWVRESQNHHLVQASRIECANVSSTNAERSWKTAMKNIVVMKDISVSSVCDSKCSCHPENGFAIVDCKHRGLNQIPVDIPKNTRNIYLNGNSISKIGDNVLTSRTWQSVHLLDLKNNDLQSINELEGTRLLRNLGALDVSDNKISHIPIHLLKQMSGIQELSFSENPWKCDCNTIVFKNWLQEQHLRVKDWDNVRCAGDAGGAYQNKAIYTVRKIDLCHKEPESVHYLDVLSIIMTILIVTILGKLLYDYWHQKRTGQLPAISKLL